MQTKPAPGFRGGASSAGGEPDVCIVMHDLRGGGAERITLRLAEAMAAAGRRVELVLFQRRGEYLDELPAAVTVSELGVRRVAAGVPRLAAHIRRTRPRAILSVMTHVNLATLAAARLAGFKGRVLVAEHNQMSRKIAGAKHWLMRAGYAAAPRFYRMADRVIAVSEGVAADLRAVTRLPNDKVLVLYNPVVDARIATLAAEPAAHPWFSDGGPPVLLAIGRLHPQKDFVTLLRAFAKVRQVRAARLVILGEGDERSTLKTLAERLGVADDVAMPGFASNPYAALSKAAAFVLSSRWEGLPTVLIEALACGTPVVATNCKSGPDEILENGRFGSLTPVGDPAALAEAILAVLESPPAPEDGQGRAAAFEMSRAAEGYMAALAV